MLLVLSTQYYSSTETRSERVWRGWQGEAAGKPFYVVEQVLAADNIMLEVRENHLPQRFFSAGYDALILSETSALDDPLWEKAMIDWISHGGHLLLPVDNPLAQKLGVRSTSVEKCNEPEASQLAWQRKGGAMLHPQTSVSQSVQSPRGHGIAAQGVRCGNQPFVVQFSFGKGEVTAFAHNLDLWRSTPLLAFPGTAVEESLIPVSKGDNAAYLHDLLKSRRKVVMISQTLLGDTPPWFLQPAIWPLLLALAGLLASLLWRFGRRFGPLLPAQEAGASNFSEHLLAAGQFWQATGQSRWLVEQARTRLLNDLQPWRRRMSKESQLIRWLGEQSGVSEQVVKQTLAGVPEQEIEFVNYMITVEKIRTVL